MINRNVKKFKEGYWYRFVKSDRYPYPSIIDNISRTTERMRFMSDGDWHLCTKASYTYRNVASFKECDMDLFWGDELLRSSYIDLSMFEECKNPKLLPLVRIKEKIDE